MIRLLLLVFSLWFSLSAHAHKASDSFIYVYADKIRLDIALEDMQRLQRFDLNGDSLLTWGELLAGESQFRALLRETVRLSHRYGDCPILFRLDGLSEHSDGSYAAWSLDAACLHETDELTLSYSLLFDIDPLHRALVAVNVGEGKTLLSSDLVQRDEQVQLSVLSPASPQLVLGNVTAWTTALKFTKEGAIHLALGYDHLMFLLALLLPVTRQRGKTPLRTVFAEVVGIVTMFTLAHSLTLVSASLGWFSLPSRPVEIGIALSISLAALLVLLNVSVVFQRRLAMTVGLLHGFGFAGVLAGMLSASPMKLVALGSFNLGIELAQLAVVVAVLPLLYYLAARPFYQRQLLPLMAIGLVASGVFMAWQRF
ncbi:MAG: HupE/UreJ family protein [Zhongshania sp.]|uniref:HupE/UreJ family protein n=1 Tax=Zhongshania sp. TaxID=1971902 RepID=UPI00261BA50A|nr:HupE/UreJ family protein [Zhongshania sp.]MDF1691196.1 HupE/UreJ family protein [Zhongshania sp.]